MRSAIALLFIPALALAQSVHEIPFASGGNEILLTVANEAAHPAEGLRLLVEQAPWWIRFAQTEILLPPIGSEEEHVTHLAFDVDRMASVNSESTIRLAVVTGSGERWEKELHVRILPPEAYELFQNFPNPFNPTTTISYQLPENARVRLRVCDVIGRVVNTLQDDRQPAGYHRVVFDGGACSSGVYIAVLEALGADGRRHALHRTMVLLR